MAIKIKANENIMGVIKKGETRNVANGIGLFFVKQGKAELVDFDGSDTVLHSINEDKRRRKVLEGYGIEYKTAYTLCQLLEILDKIKSGEIKLKN